MKRNNFFGIVLVFVLLQAHGLGAATTAQYLSRLKEGQTVADFRVAHLYSDNTGQIVGAKFWHSPTGAPVFLLQIETAPQVFTWVDAPVYPMKDSPMLLSIFWREKELRAAIFRC